MAKTVKIPDNMSPWKAIINGVEYVYPAGTTQQVPDEVADFIERISKVEPEKAPVTPPFAGSDWNASKGEPGHVLNRTHWAETTKNKVLLDTTVPASAIADGMALISLDGALEEGQNYTVTFAGQQYSCVCKADMFMHNYAVYIGNPMLFGGTQTEHPFAIAYVPWLNFAVFVPLVQAAEYVVKIEGDAKTYHTISPKFLPKPAWMIDVDMGSSESNDQHLDISQADLNRAINDGELVILRLHRRDINSTVMYAYFVSRSQDVDFEFLSYDHNTAVHYLLTPNTSGGYDLTTFA